MLVAALLLHHPSHYDTHAEDAPIPLNTVFWPCVVICAVSASGLIACVIFRDRNYGKLAS